MRIFCQDRRYAIDTQALTAFLHLEGFSLEEIAALIIHIRPQAPGQTWNQEHRTLGKFQAPRTVYIYTWNDVISEVNDTLLHELRHYWRAVEHERGYRRDLQIYKSMRGVAQRKFFDAHLFMRWKLPDETMFDYWDRPREQDARAFAERYKDHQFVSRQPVCRVFLPLDIFCAQESALEARIQRIGGILSRDTTQVIIDRVTKEDAVRLVRFLEKRLVKRLRVRGI